MPHPTVRGFPGVRYKPRLCSKDVGRMDDFYSVLRSQVYSGVPAPAGRWRRMTSDLSTPSSSPVVLLAPFSVPIRCVPSFFHPAHAALEIREAPPT